MERQVEQPSLHSASQAANQQTSRDPIMETFRILQEVVVIALLLATVYTAWSPSGLFSGNVQEQFPNLMSQASGEGGVPGATPTARPRRVGIIAGHWGNDSGAVCPDGLREVDLNLDFATRVQQNLEAMGIPTDLLREKDPKLSGYVGTVLVSIHNDSCDYYSDSLTGFKVAGNDYYNGNATRLVACMNNRYARDTGLPRHGTTITSHMTDYHVFDPENPTGINPDTPAAIIETGFMNLDRQFLTTHPDLVAKGVTDGILCFINYEDIEPASPPAPSVSQTDVPQP